MNLATFAIGKPGAINAALFACSLLGNYLVDYADAIKNYRKAQTQQVLSCKVNKLSVGT